MTNDDALTRVTVGNTEWCAVKTMPRWPSRTSRGITSRRHVVGRRPSTTMTRWVWRETSCAVVPTKASAITTATIAFLIAQRVARTTGQPATGIRMLASESWPGGGVVERGARGYGTMLGAHDMIVALRMTLLEKQAAHHTWANAIWIQFLADSGTDDAFLLGRMSHVLLGQRAWFQRIAGEPPDRNIWQCFKTPELVSLQKDHERTIQDLLRRDLAHVVDYTRFTGEHYQSTVEDLLAHAVLHGMHHRGQMAVRASQLGLVPPNTDFVQFCLTHGI